MKYFNEDSYQSETDSSMSEMIVDDLNLDIDEPKIKKKRIREKLDHLTHEEKLMRRKIKNRISAQSARDRKKNRMQTLERKIEILCEDRHKILKENAILKKQNEQIIAENSDLKKRLAEIENRLSSFNSLESSIQINSINSNQVNLIASDQINQINSTLQMNDRIDLDANNLRLNTESTSFESAALINET